MAIDMKNGSTTRPRRSAVARLYRFATGLVIGGSCLLLLGLPIFGRLDVFGILADLIDALGKPLGSGNGIFLITGLATLLVTGLGLLLMLASWRKAGASYTSAAWTTLLGVFSIIAPVIYFPGIDLALPRHPNPRVTCTNNLRQLSLGVMMYMQDHGDRLPEAWAAEIDVSESTFICPTTQRRFHKPGGYGMNTNLPGKHYNDLQDQESLLLLADSVRPGMLLASEKDIALRHSTGQGYCCSYLDGSVERREVDETLRWK